MFPVLPSLWLCFPFPVALILERTHSPVDHLLFGWALPGLACELIL
jgi:hypothetical protein